MLDLEGNPRLKRLYWIAHYRVTLGFVVAGVAFWLASPTRRSLVVGSLIAAVGEILRLWAAGHLRKGQEVTNTGPYRFVRHPLYYGSMLIGLGFAVAAANQVAGLLVLGYLVMTLSAAARLEEATLQADFGETYSRYSRGLATPSPRRFSLAQLKANGEHRAVLGFAAALAVLAVKLWLSR